jgi:hypothetical protein
VVEILRFAQDDNKILAASKMSCRLFRTIALSLAATPLLACGSDPKPLAARTLADSARADSIARARQDSINRTLPGYVVDSIFPIEEELRRFRLAAGGDSATKLSGGSRSREELVRRFVRAVEANDVGELHAMAVTTREFSDAYYMDSPYSHPPYKQPPAMAWSLIQNPSADGLTRLLRRFGNNPLGYVSHTCDPKVAREGRTTRYTGCTVRMAGAKGDTIERRLFGSIIARDGEFKFLSYTNGF